MRRAGVPIGVAQHFRAFQDFNDTRCLSAGNRVQNHNGLPPGKQVQKFQAIRTAIHKLHKAAGVGIALRQLTEHRGTETFAAAA